MEDQRVVVVASVLLAIGMLARAAAVGDTVLEVDVAGVLTTVYSGLQPAALGV